MKTKISKIRRWVNNGNVSRFRFWIQIIAFILFVYGSYFLIQVGQNLPTFACPYNPGSPGTCFLMSVQHRMHTSFSALFSWRGVGFLTSLLSFVLFFIIFNKAWCGFLCPLGTIQDWITMLRKRLGIRGGQYDEKSFKKLSWIKYVLLALLFLIPLAISNSFFGLPKLSHDLHTPFCQICPARIILPLFSGDTSQLSINFSSTVTIVMSSLAIIILALFFVGSFVKKRFFCFFCPMSALQYLFSKIGILRLTKVGDKCTRCGNCSRVCDMGILSIAEDITSVNVVTDNCMMCFKCVEACPEEDCLNVKVLNFKIFTSTEEGFFKRYNPAGDSKELPSEQSKK
ncbi:4Fe-4S binding protein [Candidatus Sulfidibacterium hydrothermale]|uniref:4Fe-4S binding protein n=1 Tax=Candidatus Sulfidibacterium hydrothermale TaxID=2875962 RepID=UPI001F0A144C|nr:4Fe-4S binding protein [Candidatus Sulfidibacterium hydrothermale]UBM61763.1 4Fe-4S binding protein [Candidatus Sulfidibacterium hydrothermale]